MRKSRVWVSFAFPDSCSKRQHNAQTHFAERYVHLASRQLARQAWLRRDRSAAHNLNWILQEVFCLNNGAHLLLTFPTNCTSCPIDPSRQGLPPTSEAKRHVIMHYAAKQDTAQLTVFTDVTHLSVLQAGLTVCTPVLNTLLRLTAQDGASAATLEDMLEDALNRGFLPS